MPWLCCHRTPKVKREDQYKVGSVLPLCGVADGTLSNEKALRWPTTWTSRRLLRRMVRRPCSRGECFYWLEVSNRGLVTFISTALVADTPRRVCSPHTVTRHSDFGDFSWHVVTFPLQHMYLQVLPFKYSCFCFALKLRRRRFIFCDRLHVRLLR